MRRILLPESKDERVLQAAADVATSGDGDVLPVLFGAPRRVGGVFPKGVEFISPPAEQYADLLRARYAPKRILTAAQTQELLSDPLHLAALLLIDGAVDGVVAGAVFPTAHVVRTALRVVQCRAGVSTLSGFFIMRLPRIMRLPSRDLLFADCALVESPTEEQLLDIAAMTAESAAIFLPEPPVVALLSFSTAGSTARPAAEKIARVAAALSRRCPDLSVVGEVQADAALDVEVAKRKGVDLPAPANVLIFPDLNAGNIAYKLVQRLTGCVAVGPVLQGLNKPFNDLSRGATTADIKEMLKLTAQQAAAQAE